MPDYMETRDSCVSDALNYLIEQSGKTVVQIANEVGISSNTLYSITGRKSSRAKISTLKKLADYFGEDLTIFCGLKEYKRPYRVSPEEQALLEEYRKLNDPAKRRVLVYIDDLKDSKKNLR